MSAMSIPDESTQGRRQAREALAKAARDADRSRRKVASHSTLAGTLREANAHPEVIADRLRTILRGGT